MIEEVETSLVLLPSADGGYVIPNHRGGEPASASSRRTWTAASLTGALMQGSTRAKKPMGSARKVFVS